MVLFSSCANQSENILSSKKIIIDDREMLYGSIDQQQLYFDYPDWKLVEDEFNFSPEYIKQLSDIMLPISVDIFLGTWCSDSKREVPAFFKIIDSAGIADKMDIKIWAVDRKKTLKNGLAKKCNIEYVPTFIFYKSDIEIGRIIEIPEGLLEEDILDIIKDASE